MNNSVKVRIVGTISFILLLIIVLPSLLFPKDDAPIEKNYVFVDENGSVKKSNVESILKDNATLENKDDSKNNSSLSLESMTEEKKESSKLQKNEISLTSYHESDSSNSSNEELNIDIPTTTTLPKKELWLRVASLTDSNNAKLLSNKLKSEGYQVKEENIVVNSIKYERILIGPFSNRSNANKVRKKLIEEGYSPNFQ